MVEILRKMFDASPGELCIVLKEKCSICGNDVLIKITPTSGGFGLQGGALFKSSPDAYCTKCPRCYTSNTNVAKAQDALCNP